MAKRVDPLKAKQAKQKKIAIVLCVFLVAVLFFQVPKTLKMLQDPQSAAAPAAGTTVGTPIAAPAAATPVAGAPAAAGMPVTGVAQPAVLVDSDIPAAAAEGQLRSFELFRAKDPFAQQNVPATITAAPATPAKQAPETVGAKPAAGGTVVEPSPDATGSTGSAAPATPKAPPPPAAAPASATSISVNGIAESVATEASFPATGPAFVLASLAKDGKSAQIGVAGGTYADGARTIKLTLGKSLTLRNTADGSQYKLELLTVQGFVTPKPKN